VQARAVPEAKTVETLEPIEVPWRHRVADSRAT
jgi:hypothetical protein